ncbi:MAG TPA: hypothetical protein VFU49_14965 [Ktedonobacteraceae bacterium]|nr:hypothetical protein [Ktedonobacteraceae bacterium]
MGVERSVTRWYIRRNIVLKEIELLEATLATMSADTALSKSEKEAVEGQLMRAREKLFVSGPCPKPMMG